MISEETKTGRQYRPVSIPERASLEQRPARPLEQRHWDAKFWLKPVRYDKSAGFNRREVLLLERLITEHLEELLRSWHDYFGS
ncbi:MAG: DUF4160 domain-containing protein [Chloroflexi bacterium]|nr:DUF4160 domain-containing protein [Chloroflexota bacterium]